MILGQLFPVLESEMSTKLRASDFGSESPGPSCSKLSTSLVNDSLKFTSSDTQIC